MNASMAMEVDTPKKSLKRRPKFKERTASDVCRLCRNNLKQKFGDFSKNSYIMAVNVFKPWTSGGRPFPELCKRIGLEIENSTTSSERVCNVCARKVQNAVEMTNTDVFADRK